MDLRRVELKQCPVCGKCFERKDTLRRHVQIHASGRVPSKQRKRACVHCFRSKIRCKGERPTCSTCIKRSLLCAYENDAETTRDNNYVHQREPHDLAPAASSTESPHAPTLYESPESTRMLSYEPIQQQELSHLPSFLTFLPDASSGSDYYGIHANADHLPGFDWVFNESFDDGLPSFSIPNTATHMSMPTPAHPAALTSAPPPSDSSRVNEQARHLDSTISLTPIEQQDDRNVPEDRWPMEWHAVPVQLNSLPDLGRLGGSFRYSSHFAHPPITPQIRNNILNTLRLPMQSSPWQAASLINFPSEGTLDHCLDLYFVHFNKSVPIIHRPTFDPAQDLVLTLAIASIGCCYTGLSGAMAFSNALSELTRRLLMFMAEYDPRFVRTGNYLTTQLLQAIHGLSSGSKRLYELGETNRSALINNARNMGIFEMHRSGDRLPCDGTLEEQWRAWIRAERLRRIAWALYLHDASSTYTRNTRPYISIMEVGGLDLPCSADHWDSDSPEAWAALHPWSRSMPASLGFTDALNSLLRSKDAIESGIRDDYQKNILLATLARLMWSTMELEFAAGGTLVNEPEGLISRRETLQAAMQCFATPLRQNAKILRHDGFEGQVQRSCLAQFAVLFDADDLVNYSHLVWRGGSTAGPTRRLLLDWAAKNPQKVRRVARACAFVLSAVRQFPFNHHLEAHHAFHTGFLLWTMIPLLLSLQRDAYSDSLLTLQEESGTLPICQLDWLGPEDTPEGQVIANWLMTGSPCVLRMHTIPDVLTGEGTRNVLQQTADVLKRMPVWGIAQVLRNAVLRALYAGEE